MDFSIFRPQNLSKSEPIYAYKKKHVIFAAINFRAELIFANWPNSWKLNPAKSKNSHSRKLIPTNTKSSENKPALQWFVEYDLT